MSVRTSNSINMEGTTVSEKVVSRSDSTSADSTAVTPSEAFKEILIEKLGSVRDTLEEMREQKEAIQTVKNEGQVTEIVRRMMPDGSIMITEYVEGKVKSRQRKPPHMEYVVDKNQPIPKNEEGMALPSKQAMVLKPKFSVAEELFNM
ncbi:hypothetical protein [Anaerovibrio sp. RM50]|uniref:hypothetical protein n=1 Tax=Anaerovibrio sp. RM50 TaxID=1200557 RepID=UPI0004892F4E|nr:hypothetical protein [Anaerovibrio sp. RM50]